MKIVTYDLQSATPLSLTRGGKIHLKLNAEALPAEHTWRVVPDSVSMLADAPPLSSIPAQGMSIFE